MAVAVYLHAQPAAAGDAEAVGSALSSAVEGAIAHQKRYALRCACGVGDMGAVPIDELAQRGRVDGAGPSPSANPRGNSGSVVACAGHVRRVEAEVLDLVAPADGQLIPMLVRLEPRDRLVVCPQVEIRPAPRRPPPST